MTSGRDSKPDWFLMTAPILIFLTGILFLFSASWREGQSFDQSLVVRQCFWMATALVFMLISLKFHYRYLLVHAWPIYFSVIVLLIIVLFMPEKLGARRWIHFGFFNLQPSELAKIGIIAILACIMKDRDFAKDSRKMYLIPVLITLIPVLLIMKEPDLGTSLLFWPVLFSMMYISGFRFRWMASILGLCLAASPFLYQQLKPYQKQRIITFLNPDLDPLGSGYTIIQSKIAIGSGGLFGKGFREGTQTQLQFLPERHTDFIFSVIGEEGGFLGASIVIFLTWLIIFRGFRIAHHCNNRFGKLLATGITTLLATQAFVNIAMTMGILPVVGMPLFLVSYGGSSLIVSMFLIGILINIGMRRDPFA